MINDIMKIFADGSETYNTILTIISIGLIIIAIYNRIKYLCLEKASEKVAEVEKMTELSGSEKFALVVLWINESLPKVFRTAFFQAILEKIINYAYDNSKSYALNYIKRKTGYDISELLETLENTSTAKPEDTKSDDSTTK